MDNIKKLFGEMTLLWSSDPEELQRLGGWIKKALPNAKNSLQTEKEFADWLVESALAKELIGQQEQLEEVCSCLLSNLEILSVRVQKLEQNQMQTQAPPATSQEVEDLKARNQELEKRFKGYNSNEFSEEEALEVSRRIHEEYGTIFDSEKARKSFNDSIFAKQKGFEWHTRQAVEEALKRKVSRQAEKNKVKKPRPEPPM